MVHSNMVFVRKKKYFLDIFTCEKAARKPTNWMFTLHR